MSNVGGSSANATRSLRRRWRVCVITSELWIKLKDTLVAFKPEFCFLTGGGNRIPVVRQELTLNFASISCRVVTVPKADPRSTKEPRVVKKLVRVEFPRITSPRGTTNALETNAGLHSSKLR